MASIQQSLGAAIVSIDGQGGAVSIDSAKHVASVARSLGYAIGAFDVTLDDISATEATMCLINITMYDVVPPLEVGAFPPPYFEPIVMHVSDTVKRIFFQIFDVPDDVAPFDPLSFSFEIFRLANAPPP
jgi:hypothetical protein